MTICSIVFLIATAMLADLGLDDLSIESEFTDDDDDPALPGIGGVATTQKPITTQSNGTGATKVGGAPVTKGAGDSDWDSTIASDTQTPRKLPDTARVSMIAM